MALLVLLTSTVVLTLLPGWRLYLTGLAITAGLLAWCYWPMPGTGNYGAVLADYVIAIGSPFCWLAFVIAMVGKIVWLGGIVPATPFGQPASVGGPSA